MRNKILAILVGVVTVLSSAMPIFASNTSVAHKVTDFAYSLRLDKRAYVVPEEATELVVPIYMQITSTDFAINRYYSGYAYTQTSSSYATSFGIDTNAPVNVYFSYFEPINDHIYLQSFPTSQSASFTLAFDNFLFESGYTLIGYNHYTMDMQHQVFTFSFPNITVSYQPSTHAIYQTDYQFGFYNACYNAIDTALMNSQNVQEMVHYLQDLYQEMAQANSAFLTHLTTANTTLDAIDTLLGHIFSDTRNINSTLVQFYTEYYNVVHATKDASVIQDDVEEKAQISQSLAAGMAMQRPDIEADDVDINEMIDQDMNAKFGIAVGSIFSSNFLVTMMLIAVSAMIIGFVLYGKK